MPYTIIDIDLTRVLPTLVVPEEYVGVAVIVRRQDQPIGFLMRSLPGGTVLTPDHLEKIVTEGINPELLQVAPFNDPVGVAESMRPRSLTVTVCTRDHPRDLAQCLDHLLCLRDADPQGGFEILVVDNAPSDVQTRNLVAFVPGVRYVMEPKPGLNFARNRSLQEATGELIAFIDDDVTVDQYWLRGLRRAISEHPDAGAVTGLVLPFELETEAQILFERRGGFEKSFRTIRYSQTLAGHPFYPCVGGKFGTGCNMAFVKKLLLELGGFDEALDTGPPLPGGGDTDMLYRVVHAGHPLIYEPQFMVFHRHRREVEALRRQYCRSWSQGLMAWVVKTYKVDPIQRPNLRRLVIWWFGNEMKELYKTIVGRHVLSPDMILAELWGGIIGLCRAYPRSVKRIEMIRKKYLSQSPDLCNAAVRENDPKFKLHSHC